jgi:hypothetical protein
MLLCRNRRGAWNAHAGGLAASMALAVTIVLGLTVRSGFSQTSQSDPLKADPMHLVLTWVDPDRVIPRTSGLSAEVDSFFETIGVIVDWRHYSGRHAPSETEVELHVHLKTTEPTHWNLGQGALGVAFRAPVRTARVYVFFPAVARVLGQDPKALKSFVRSHSSARLNRALARVIVHEVFHAIAPSLPHADSGLTQSVLTRCDLLTGAARVDPAVASLFREKLRERTANLVMHVEAKKASTDAREEY